MTSIEQTEMGLVMNLAILACIVGTIIPARLPVLLDSGVLVWGLPVVLLGVCYTWPRMLAAFYLGLYVGGRAPGSLGYGGVPARKP